MKNILACLKGSVPATVLAPLFMGLEVYCDLQQPWLMARIINQGVLAGNLAVVTDTGLWMVLMAVLGLAGGIGCNFFATLASQGFALRLRSRLFGQVQGFALGNLQKFGSSSLLTRLGNDTGMLQQVLTMMLQILVRAPLLFIGGIIMAVQIKAELSVVLLAAIPALGLFLALVIKTGFARFAAVQAAVDRITAFIQENLRGMRVVKSFVRSDHQQERFGRSNQELVDMTIKASGIMTLMMPVISVVMTGSVAAVLALGGNMTLDGRLDIGRLMSLITYITQILASLMMLSMMLTIFSRAKASYDRVVEVLDEVSTVRDGGTTPASPVAAPLASPATAATPTGIAGSAARLEFRQVTFRHPLSTGEPALDDISFVLEPGMRLAVLGATGSGKSSLVNLIPRLHDPQAGSICLDGRDVRDWSLQELRAQVGMATQRSVLFSGSIRDNLAWGNAGAGEDRLRAAAASAQALEFIERLPDGLDTWLGQGGVNLSGGQRQRLCIARALVRCPRLLILDDAASALDTATEARLLAALAGLRGGTSVIQIAQRVSSVREADRILILEDGHLTAWGTHQELLAASPAYREINDSQKEGRIHE